MIQKAIGRIRIDSDYKNSTQIPYINKENFDSAKYSEYDEVEENSAVALDFHVVHFDMTFSLFILCLFDFLSEIILQSQVEVLCLSGLHSHS